MTKEINTINKRLHQKKLKPQDELKITFANLVQLKKEHYKLIENIAYEKGNNFWALEISEPAKVYGCFSSYSARKIPNEIPVDILQDDELRNVEINFMKNPSFDTRKSK